MNLLHEINRWKPEEIQQQDSEKTPKNLESKKKKTLRNNMWVKEGISRQILRYFELNGQFSLQSQRKAMPTNAQITTQLHSSHMLVK